MDNLNKTISFVLGLVVVLVFFAVISGRINLKGKLPFISNTKSATVTPTPTKTTSTDQLVSEKGSYKSNAMVKTPTSIPQTGSPTLLIPILISGLGGGLILRRTKSK